MTLRFTRLELREVRIPFRFAFKHSLAVRREANNLILTLATDAGVIGYGEVIPRTYLTGESVETAWQDIRSHYWPTIRELKLSTAASPWEALQPCFAWATAHRKTAAYAGLDLAVWDAWARTAKRPGYSLFGQRRPLPVSITGPLGVGSLHRVWKLASLMRFLGFSQFKLKVGNSSDLATVRLVRQIIGRQRDLRVDANGGWNVDQAITRIQEFKQFGVSSVEQPIPAGDSQTLALVQREGGLPVMADESLCTLTDAKNLLEHQAADIWNLRLAKIGGFTGLLAMLEVAGFPLPWTPKPLVTGYRPQMQLGTLVGETSILTAAARACLGLCPFRHVEFGFPRILLQQDPFRGDPGGYLSIGNVLNNGFGLGVSPHPGRLDSVTRRREVLT